MYTCILYVHMHTLVAHTQIRYTYLCLGVLSILEHLCVSYMFYRLHIIKKSGHSKICFIKPLMMHIYIFQVFIALLTHTHIFMYTHIHCISGV